MNVVHELQALQRLYQSGAINQYEFHLAKAKLLRSAPEAQPSENTLPRAAVPTCAGTFETCGTRWSPGNC